jgi:hypothetical protein
MSYYYHVDIGFHSRWYQGEEYMFKVRVYVYDLYL